MSLTSVADWRQFSINANYHHSLARRLSDFSCLSKMHSLTDSSA